MDLYETLGVARDATQEDIKKAYQQAAKKNHPDSNERDENRWAEVLSAYEVLKDPGRRRIYDETGVHNKDHDTLIAKCTASAFMGQFNAGSPKPIQNAILRIRDENRASELLIAKYRDQKKKVESMLGRLHKKSGGQDPIREALLSQQQELHNRIMAGLYTISVMTEVAKNLADYKIEQEPMPVVRIQLADKS